MCNKHYGSTHMHNACHTTDISRRVYGTGAYMNIDIFMMRQPITQVRSTPWVLHRIVSLALIMGKEEKRWGMKFLPGKMKLLSLVGIPVPRTDLGSRQ